MYQSLPVKWYQLIGEMEAFTERTGWGLAKSWRYVHRENYKAARSHFDETVHLHREAEEGSPLMGDEAPRTLRAESDI